MEREVLVEIVLPVEMGLLVELLSTIVEYYAEDNNYLETRCEYSEDGKRLRVFGLKNEQDEPKAP